VQSEIAHPKPQSGILRHVVEIGQIIIVKWTEDRLPQQAAAISYYTFFSLAPLLIIIIAVAGLVLGRDIVQTGVMRQIQSIVGIDAANTIQSIVLAASRPAAGVPAAILGVIALIGGSLGVFGQIQSSLNQIWHVPNRPSAGFRKDALAAVQQQLILFLMVMVAGLLFLLTLASGTILTFVSTYIDAQLGNSIASAQTALWSLANFLIVLAITVLLFAAIYKILPQAPQSWRDVLVGAVLTAVLFSVGRLLIGLYLGRSGITSAYGAAGSLVVILLWINYSAQIFLLGAEFTYIYSTRYGTLSAVAKIAAAKSVTTAETPH